MRNASNNVNAAALRRRKREEKKKQREQDLKNTEETVLGNQEGNAMMNYIKKEIAEKEASDESMDYEDIDEDGIDEEGNVLPSATVIKQLREYHKMLQSVKKEKAKKKKQKEKEEERDRVVEKYPLVDADGYIKSIKEASMIRLEEEKKDRSNLPLSLYQERRNHIEKKLTTKEKAEDKVEFM